MKRVNLLTLVFIITASISVLVADGKMYQVKSGIIEYRIEGGGSIMGVSSKTTGSEKLIFKDWGNLQLQEERSSSSTMGHTDEIHNLVKIDHGKVYSVDFNNRVITKMDPAMLAESKDKDLSKMGKEMLESMGGKKIGTGKIVGYECEIWELMGTKIWLYKGVTLKTEANLMGMKHMITATKAKFDLSIPDNKFKLPNYPIQTMDQMIKNSIQKEQLPTDIHSDSIPSPEEMKQLEGLMKNLGGMFGK